MTLSSRQIETETEFCVNQKLVRINRTSIILEHFLSFKYNIKSLLCHETLSYARPFLPDT